MNMSAPETLQAAMEREGNAARLMRNVPGRPNSQTVTPQFTNWQSEVRAWRDACAFMDQSHHMVDLYISGPDALAMLSHLGVNSFAGFGPGMAKQFVCVSPDGWYIGDAVLICLADGTFNMVGRRCGLDWVEWNAQTGGWNVTVERDAQTMDRAGANPRMYRYEVQGPHAAAVIEEVTGAPLPDVRFFGMTTFTIAGKQVQALRHGMAGEIGFEVFGPWAEGADVREAILRTGERYGMLQVGSVAYSTANLESGWIPGPVPGIFHQDELRDYRAWLPLGRAGVIAGSLASDDIRDYYTTPYDLGYGKIVKFDHDFIGAEALKARAEQPQRRKVTLVWDAEDVARVVSSQWRDGPKYKYLSMPKGRYGLFQMDDVLVGGARAGISMDCGYLANEKKMVSLAVVDAAHAETGTEVEIVWGESPNTAKLQVEPHEQTRIRAKVAPAPYGLHARQSYRSNG